jgi:hypothetical protein
VKNFSSDAQNNALMKYALENDMEYSGTSAGDVVKQRVGSYTGWIYPDPTEDYDGHCFLEDDSINAKNAAGYMTELSRFLFVPDDLNTMMESYSAEALQVVRYEIGGQYDVHHDGMNRFLTVLTYLNGVAGTWFPYAIVKNDQQSSVDVSSWNVDDLPSMNSGNVAHDKTPGQDGLLIVSHLQDVMPSGNRFPTSSNNVLRIEKGDAVVFYNYDWIENFNGEDDIPQTGPIINWRSIHSGTRTTEEKWIATNWFYFHE